MAEPELPPAPASLRWPWARIVLVLSLGANLLVLGMVGGAVLRDGPPGRSATLRELNFGHLTEALSRDDREALRRSFLRAVPDMKGQRREMQSDLAEFLTVLRAADFSREKVEAVFQRNSERMARRHDLGQNLMLDLLEAMSPDARSAFADRLELAMKRERKPGNP